MGYLIIALFWFMWWCMKLFFQHMLVGDLQSDYTSGNMDVYTAI